MDPMQNRETVEKQYRTAENLGTRISIHSKYSTNRQGFANWILSRLPLGEGLSVLELGCGSGELWAGQEARIAQCARFVLSDLSEGMIRAARERLGGGAGIEYRIIDIGDIPFPAQSFDVVIANMMLYHVPDLPGALREVRRVLKPGGTFCCATYGEHGIMETVCGFFRDYGVEDRTNHSFTLQNGEAQLQTVFSSVERLLYEDALAVTDAEDMADYIDSLPGFEALRRLPRETVRAVLEAHMEDGVLHIPKEYGMFLSSKR